MSADPRPADVEHAQHRQRARPAERSWTVAILLAESNIPVGSGVLVDSQRVLTCRHVVQPHPSHSLRVAFPAAEDPYLPSLEVVQVDIATHPQADIAVLTLAGEAPAGVEAAPLLQPHPRDLVGREWWAYGYGDSIGNEASGAVGAELSYGWVRIDGDSRYDVDKGFSGAGLWSTDYRAVVGVVGQAHTSGDGRCLTLKAAAKTVPGHDLTALTITYRLEAAGPDAVAAWGWQLTSDPEGRRHWKPRARGVTQDSEAGWRFRGRRAALSEIVWWISADQVDRKLLVVTGSPGVGKSALLARIITTADRDVAALLPPDDTSVRAPVGSVACAVHAKSKTALEVAREIARAASAGLPQKVEDLAPALRDALTDGPDRGRFTVVVDALDEAATADEARRIVGQVLLPVVEVCADLGARVIVGTRRWDEGGDLIGSFGNSSREIDLDDPAYLEDEDLVSYALATLQLEGSPRADNPYREPDIALPVAERIAEIATPNFLVAGLLARARGLHDSSPVDPTSLTRLPADRDRVEVAFGDYLERMDGAGTLSPRDLFTALAYAEAPGLTLELWSTALHAVLGRTVGVTELARFVAGSAANFLLQAVESSGSYRLFHQALNDTLAARRPTVEDQRALTVAFLLQGVSSGSGWESAPEYLLRSLSHHAVAGDSIDLVLADKQYLLHADLSRVIPAAGGARTPGGQSMARLLRKTPLAIEAPPHLRLAMFQMAEAIHQVDTGFRTLTERVPYQTLWTTVIGGPELVTLTGHTGAPSVVCTITVRDRELLVSAAGDILRDKSVRIWDPVTGQQETVIMSPDVVQGMCAVEVGGRDLIVAGGPAVRMWDPVTGQERATLSGHSDWVRDACQVRVGERDRLVTASDDGEIRLWDPASGECERVLTGHSGWVMCVCSVSVEGRDHLASGGRGTTEGRDQTVRLWDPATGANVRTLTGHDGGINAVCSVRVGERDLLASASDDGTVRMWDPVSGEHTATLTGHAMSVNAVCAVRGSDGEVVASGGSDGSVRLWDPVTSEQLAQFDSHSAGVNGLCAVQVSGLELLASVSDDQTLRLWDPATRTAKEQVAGAERSGRVQAMTAVTVGSRRLIAVAGDRGVDLRQPGNGRREATLATRFEFLVGMCSVRVGDRDLLCYARDYEKKVELWNPTTATRDSAIPIPQTATCLSAVPVPGGDRDLVAVGFVDGSVMLCDPHPPKRGPVSRWFGVGHRPGVVLRGHTGTTRALCAIGVDDQVLIASCSDDRTVRLWDPRTARHRMTLTGHTDWVRAVCSVRVGDSNLLASAGDDKSVRLWNPVSGSLEATLTGHTGWVRHLCTVQVRDAVLLASAGEDQSIRFWNGSDGRLVLSIDLPSVPRALASPDANLVIIGLDSGAIALSLADLRSASLEWSGP